LAPHLDVPRTAHAKAEALRFESGTSKPYIILHPGSARREKLWEPARWVELIEHFGHRNEFHVVLTSGSSAEEQMHIRAITKDARQQIVDLSGKTDLLTLTSLIARAQLLVTVDSAPVHLAAAMRTPQVALFGPTNPFHWRPRESPALILHGKSVAPVSEFAPVRPRLPMSEISTEAVISAMEALLPRRAAAQTS
jgi:ADP-heptose:LPS heptosyltransferase